MPQPATSYGFRRRSALGGLLLSLMVLTGCTEGDFGRLRSSLVTDDIHSWIGTEAVGVIGGTQSRYSLTDDERQLRDLAYPLIEAPFDRQRWYSILGEYGLNRVRGMHFDRTAYSSVLMARPVRSQTTRYGTMLDDIRNDIARIDPFFRAAARVSDLDGKRAKSLPYVTGLSEAERANALNRIAENQLVIGWVQHALHQRVDGYRYALERLVIAFPSGMAVEAEQELNRLRVMVEQPQLVAANGSSRGRFSK